MPSQTLFRLDGSFENEVSYFSSPEEKLNHLRKKMSEKQQRTTESPSGDNKAIVIGDFKK